jgi:hypothetical protein
VWGPEPIALGFIGAPLATAISFNLISIASIVYGIFFVPHTAWHPFCRRSFTSLGVLVRLGMGGVGQSYRSIISPLLTTYVHVQGKLHPSGGVGNSSAVSHSFERRNGLADQVVPSCRQPVSHKRSGLYSLLMAKLKLASDLPS